MHELQERRRRLLGHDDNDTLLVCRCLHLQVGVDLRDVADSGRLRRAGIEYVGGARFGPGVSDLDVGCPVRAAPSAAPCARRCARNTVSPSVASPIADRNSGSMTTNQAMA